MHECYVLERSLIRARENRAANWDVTRSLMATYWPISAIQLLSGATHFRAVIIMGIEFNCNQPLSGAAAALPDCVRAVESGAKTMMLNIKQR